MKTRTQESSRGWLELRDIHLSGALTELLGDVQGLVMNAQDYGLESPGWWSGAHGNGNTLLTWPFLFAKCRCGAVLSVPELRVAREIILALIQLGSESMINCFSQIPMPSVPWNDTAVVV